MMSHVRSALNNTDHNAPKRPLNTDVARPIETRNPQQAPKSAKIENDQGGENNKTEKQRWQDFQNEYENAFLL